MTRFFIRIAYVDGVDEAFCLERDDLIAEVFQLLKSMLRNEKSVVAFYVSIGGNERVEMFNKDATLESR